MRADAAMPRRPDIHNLQVSHIRIRGDPLLYHRTKRPAYHETHKGEDHREGRPQKSPGARPRASKCEPGKGRGQKYGGCQVRPASSMDGELAFTRAQTTQRLLNRGSNFFGWKVAQDEKAGRVGMPGHIAPRIFRGQYMQGGVFEGMIAAGFKNEWKREDRVRHLEIIQPHELVFLSASKVSIRLSKIESVNAFTL